MSLIGDNMENNNLSILGAGFACIDMVRLKNKDTIMLGGTAANVLSILALLGLETEFLTAKYYGESGRYIEAAFQRRGVQCIYYSISKNFAPKVIEGFDQEKHFFTTVCPKCGQNLVKCNLPTIGQMDKVKKQHNRLPNIFFFDRISEGIKEYARKNKRGWNVYEPNSCRMYSHLVGGISVADIVKYSEDRISPKYTERIISDIKDTNVILLIVTMGENGIKFIYRNEVGEFSEWNYISAASIDKVIDSSGSGDWVTALFLYFLLQKYPIYTGGLNGKYIEQCLIEAQRYAEKNCCFVGAQGMLRDLNMIEKINLQFNRNISTIRDPKINWEYDCDYCFKEVSTL